MKKILVTGGAGFIGSHTVDLLLQQGFQVVVFDNLSTGKLSQLDLFHPAFQMVQQDVLDYSVLLSELSRCDAVLHLAALASVPESIENPIQSLKVNTLGFLSVLEGIRALKKTIRLVYATSAAVYGQAVELPCSDEVPLTANVLSPYALDKMNLEKYADLYYQLFGIPSLGLRYFNVYGPRQDPASPYSGVITKFIHCFQKNETLSIFGDGEQSRDFIHVSDVSKANLLALKNDYCGVLNIATGVAETLNNLVSYLEKVSGKILPKEYFPAKAGDIAHSYGSVSKAKQNLNFKSTISLKNGIETLYRSYHPISNQV